MSALDEFLGTPIRRGGQSCATCANVEAAELVREVCRRWVEMGGRTQSWQALTAFVRSQVEGFALRSATALKRHIEVHEPELWAQLDRLARP